MYTGLLKQHEEILKKLTDKASKETGFGECISGQFINWQKMIDMEIRFIKNLNEIIEEYSDKENESNQTKEVAEESKPNKYVYAYTDFVDDKSVITLIYFDEFDGQDDINISNVRNVKSIDEAIGALLMANLVGHELIIDNTMLGSDVNLKLKSVSDSIDIKLVRPTREICSQAYCRYSNSVGKVSTSNELAKESLDAFKEIKTSTNQGYVTWTLGSSDERESLLKAIIIAYHTIVELNK